MAVYTTIDDAGSFYNTLLYTGNASTINVTGVGFQPDLCWVKEYASAEAQTWYDAVRGATYRIRSNTDAAQDTESSGLTSFDADGFTSGQQGGTNSDGGTYVSWNWKAGTTSGLTGGTITPSAYSISTTAGQSVIAYTGTGSAATVPHGLGVAPSLIITKSLVATQEWCVYHKVLGATKYMFLNETSAAGTGSAYYNDVEPTSTLFTIGTAGPTNSSSAMIAYCFAPVKGYSKMGGYTGNANADGTFVYTGFRPAFVLIKHTTPYAENWNIYDNKRLGYNVDNDALNPNVTTAGYTTDDMDILSNGFKLRTTNSRVNDGSFIYAAFAEFPIVSSNDVPTVAR